MESKTTAADRDGVLEAIARMNQNDELLVGKATLHAEDSEDAHGRPRVVLILRRERSGYPVEKFIAETKTWRAMYRMVAQMARFYCACQDIDHV